MRDLQQLARDMSYQSHYEDIGVLKQEIFFSSSWDEDKNPWHKTTIIGSGLHHCPLHRKQIIFKILLFFDDGNDFH